MAALNEKYTGRTGSTDVLAFAQQEGANRAPDANLLGDVIVDVTTVRAHARAYGIPLVEELLRVVAHGFLHLLGYDHAESAGTKRMREAEDRCIKRYFALGSKQQ
jgi:rRNA maturation RNase YbeY